MLDLSSLRHHTGPMQWHTQTHQQLASQLQRSTEVAGTPSWRPWNLQFEPR
eukprot:CAMPEP_0181459278 /NCGR_PEP_ID=MMETSP1110-20121109/32746_1 /TAXON_ID=174948 /ORGANISM="Symbiodinium sp., Strain CCMP421" /LENGTH=50 /DNA_ID=CAMNT_0023583799 /DNA_START=60 /DNA_END=209 /DNA_ORIENTATION=-